MVDDFGKQLNKHFKEDSDKAKADDIRFTKLTELAEINGNHLSYFNKNLEIQIQNVKELKDMLIEQNKMSAFQNSKITSNMERIEPMLRAFEENKTFIEGLRRRGSWVLAGAGALITLSASWFLIKQFLINLK